MKSILIIGPALMTDGYGQMMRDLIKCLKNDYKVSVRSIEWGKPDLQFLREEEKWIRPLIVDTWVPGRPPAVLSGYDIAIQCLTADNFHLHKVPGAYNVGYTMWETNKIPAHWVDACNQMDLILVPSTFCQKTFKESGIAKPIERLPIHIDGTRFAKVPENDNLKKLIRDRYSFYSIFQWTERKNPTALINAYYANFSAQDQAVLILKTYFGPDDKVNAELVNQKLNEFRRSIRRDASDYPDIVCVTDHVTTENIDQIHKSCDCYVCPVRGEGYSIPLISAIMAGKHIIATADQAYADFADTYYWFKFQLYDLIPYQMEPCHTQGPLYTADQHWASVDVSKFGKAMRRQYDEWLIAKRSPGTSSFPVVYTKGEVRQNSYTLDRNAYANEVTSRLSESAILSMFNNILERRIQ